MKPVIPGKLAATVATRNPGIGDGAYGIHPFWIPVSAPYDG